MSALAIAAIICACILGSAILGMLARTVLPKHHFEDESKDIVKTGMGLVATMTALVLGLLVASAKSSFDAQKNGLDDIAANFTVLDNILAEYGPSAQEPRELLRRMLTEFIARRWPQDASQVPALGGAEALPSGRSFYSKILVLSPENAKQTTLHSQALQVAATLGHERLLLVAEQQSAAASGVFLVVVTFWLVILFGSFGLFAPRNALAVGALAVSALSVAGAIFLTLELTQPYSGLIQISSAPLRYALTHLGE